MSSLFRNPSTRQRYRPASKPGALAVRFWLGFLLTYTAWVWSGLRPSFHWVGVGIAGILLVTVLRHAWRVVMRDPVFWLGVCFVGYLLLQCANAGRELYFDVGYQRWRYLPPPWPGWPSAFARADAWQMVTWFFPAWAVAVALRGRLMSRRDVRGLLFFLACQAGALAVFGIIQMISGTTSIYWLQPLRGHFFASFAYGNHTAPYFVLFGALTAGLLYADVLDSRLTEANGSRTHLRHPVRVAVLVVLLLLCLAGAILGFSRAGVILACGLSAVIVVYGIVRGWMILPPAGRLNLVVLSLAAASSLYFGVISLGERGIQEEFTLRESFAGQVPQTAWERIELELGFRPKFAQAAVAIWWEAPWLGVGGWGYKYRVADHVPEKFWNSLERRGWANVHFDFLQFLAEFGLVGMGLLMGALSVMVWHLFRGPRRGALWVMGVGGLALVVVFSLIDLPFRCPAILLTWVAVLGALPVACEARHLTQPSQVVGLNSKG